MFELLEQSKAEKNKKKSELQTQNQNESDLQLNPQLEPEKEPKVKKDDIFTDFFYRPSKNNKNLDVIECILNGYVLTEKFEKSQSESEKLNSIKDFIINYKKIYEYINSIDEVSSELTRLKNVLEENYKIILNIEKTNFENEEIQTELRRILDTTLKVYQELVGEIVADEKQSTIESDADGIELKKIFVIPEVNEAYIKLKEALDKNDMKEITAARGRVIKSLRKHKKEIDESYNEVKCLKEIFDIIVNKINEFEIRKQDLTPEEVEKIKELLSQNEKYEKMLLPLLNDIKSFINVFLDIYIKEQVKRKTLYKESLAHEIKKQKELLKKRYSWEFLDKKGTLKGLITTLPNALGISIKKAANAIDELKNAETKRRKNYARLEVAKNIGNVAATPAIYAGKFLANNWYSLYALYKGYSKVKQQEEQEQLREEENKTESEPKAEEKPRTNVRNEHSKKIHEMEQEKADKFADKQIREDMLKKMKEAEETNANTSLSTVPSTQRLLDDAKNEQPSLQTELEPEKEQNNKEEFPTAEEEGNGLFVDFGKIPYIDLGIPLKITTPINKHLYDKYASESEKIDQKGLDLGLDHDNEYSEFVRKLIRDKKTDLAKEELRDIKENINQKTNWFMDTEIGKQLTKDNQKLQQVIDYEYGDEIDKLKEKVVEGKEKVSEVYEDAMDTLRENIGHIR